MLLLGILYKFILSVGSEYISNSFKCKYQPKYKILNRSKSSNKKFFVESPNSLKYII